MKRRAVILFLCLYIIAAVFAVRMSVHVTGNDTEKVTEDDGMMDIVATDPEIWETLEDYFYYANTEAWYYPSAYVGAEAYFNLMYVEDFVIASEEEITAEYDSVEQFDSFMFSEFTDESEIYSLKVVITDYEFVLVDEESQTGDVWFKIEAAEGYTLPDELIAKPYILNIAFYEDIPSLLFLPESGMFNKEFVDVQRETTGASKYDTIETAKVPAIFNINYLYEPNYKLKFYDLGDVSDWENISDERYRYVNIDDVSVFSRGVTVAYNSLMAAESASEFYTAFYEIPEDVLAKFTEEHKAKIISHIEHLTEIENVEYSTTTELGGKEVNVSVVGKIPQSNIELSVAPVANDDILNGGFGIESAEDIVAALDIKLINKEDGTEWQPEEGFPVELSIDMASLGYEDGTVFQLHHKHGDRIDKYEVFVVEEGKITFITGGFSIYVVTSTNSTNTTGESIQNGRSDTLYVGDEVIYYFNNTNDGTWTVVDTAGAINYTVYGNVSSESIGSEGVAARWIKIVALRETNNGIVNEPITLSYTYYANNRSNTETYTINVETPRATGVDSYNENSSRRLYIKDLVNSEGKISAELVDRNGNVIKNGLDGAAYSWTRDDGLFIVPAAYKDNYKSVDIARDHGGLVEARMEYDNNNNPIGYEPVTYELKVTLSDGTILEEKYTVYYQSEIINAGFEFPNSSASSVYSFFPNGWPELYWKTTAQGPGNNVSKDVEYGDVSSDNGSQFGVTHAADWDPDTRTGVQFAELNAEAFGALYQDIITVPSSSDSEETIEWNFAHAKRIYQSWAPDATNKMFVVIGATEAAQKLTKQEDLLALGTAAKNAAIDKGTEFNNKFLNCEAYVEVADKNGAVYWVWYHDADTAHVGYDKANNYGWSNLEGAYRVPEGQYRTRVFFVSDPPRRNGNVIDGSKNAGNLIDVSQAGQYKHYLIEYYEETYVDGVKQVKYWGEYDEDGTALIYSSEPLDNFKYFDEPPKDDGTGGMGDYLHRIIINGSNYPYDIRYSGDPSLYIEKYPGNPADVTPPSVTSGSGSTNTYGDYDIVVQIFFRDTVIAVQKQLVLPSGMTEEQKLTLFDEINLENPLGYQSQFQLVKTENGAVVAEASTSITQRDPKGEYKGYVALGDNPDLDVEYQVEELKAEKDPIGLVLEKVEFHITRYKMGEELHEDWDAVYEDYNIVSGDSERLLSEEFILIKNEGIKVADIKVTNTYGEKMTTIYYQAVGNGKVAITPEEGKEPNFLDTPTEELAFYSGKAVGASVYAGEGASFVGWYTDPSCEDQYLVTAKDGVWDKNTGEFKPNANILNDTEVTFYAKFDTYSVDIVRDNAAPNQTFVYKVEKMNGTKVESTMYVTLVCDANGDGKVSILETPKGDYRITELDSWSWRHPYASSAESIRTGSHGENASVPLTVTFDGSPNKHDWLNGYSESLKNIWRKLAG